MGRLEVRGPRRRRGNTSAGVRRMRSRDRAQRMPRSECLIHGMSLRGRTDPLRRPERGLPRGFREEPSVPESRSALVPLDGNVPLGRVARHPNRGECRDHTGGGASPEPWWWGPSGLRRRSRTQAPLEPQAISEVATPRRTRRRLRGQRNRATDERPRGHLGARARSQSPKLEASGRPDWWRHRAGSVRREGGDRAFAHRSSCGVRGARRFVQQLDTATCLRGGSGGRSAHRPAPRLERTIGPGGDVGSGTPRRRQVTERSEAWRGGGRMNA